MLTDLELLAIAEEAYDPGHTVTADRFPLHEQSTDTKGVMYWFPETREAVIGFAGTESLADVLTDIRVIYDDGPFGGKVHRGVNRAVVSVEQVVLEWVLERKPLIVTAVGHSLGFGKACGMIVRMRGGFWSARCRGFGGMRTGDVDYAAGFAGVDVVNYALGHDPVPHVPHWLYPGPDRLGNGKIDLPVSTVPIGTQRRLSPSWWWWKHHPLARYRTALEGKWFA